jgi:cyclopropane fatty-acyl-phospholipid synthase-like methyltransferase
MGCGYGLLSLLIAARGPAREVVGIDLLDSRLKVGRTVAAAEGLGNVRFERRDFSELPEGRFAAIIFSDALFYYSMERQREILEQCRDSLSEGGVMLIKEQGRRPAWKARLVELQERLVVTAKTRIGKSREWREIAADGIYLWNVDQLADFLRSRGLAVEQQSLDDWSYLSHYLVVAWNERQGST